MEILIYSLWLLLFLGVILLVMLALDTLPLHWITTPPRIPQFYTPQTRRRRPARKHRPRQKYQHDIPKTAMWHKLLTLVQGDTDAAERLIKYEQSRNPDRSIDWCVEKAVWQLERDRR
jgi:hypothetical protein